MTRRAILISGIITFVLIGGAVVSGAQNNTVAPSDTVVPMVKTATSSATTLPASGVTNSTATLYGVIRSNGEELLYWFEYSSDPELGQILIRRTPRVGLITSSQHFSVEAGVAVLSGSTTYYYRLVIKNSDGTVRGERLSFNTR